MKIYQRLGFAVVLLSLSLLLVTVAAVRPQSAKKGLNANQARFPCLQPPIKPDDVVTFGRGGTSKKVTVKDKLIELKATCRKGNLVDGKRRGIRFFQTECWGNPPADYLEVLRKQREEIAQLKKKYTVIEMTCDPRVML